MPFPGYIDHPLLPASAPKGQSHVFKDGELLWEILEPENAEEYELCDYLPTLLHHLEDFSEALERFFDPKVKTFKFIHHKSENLLLPLAILRKGKTVICGRFEIHDGIDEAYWETITKTELTKVAPDAEWKTTWSACSAKAKLPIDACWDSGYFRVSRECLKSGDYNSMARRFGWKLVTQPFWEKTSKGTEFVLETSK
ncbi:hypothetical protein FB567DRAFT_591836 [Paraphoma chrysanthemicola]|uniref:Uncharacterized protein n=1 Tax=Paraphoma chrysanthemicola TaxID=798071 RepID=A0A8K0R610_9PLEO|nr:hypothetical protein FB567DRAFT_591836 [Paraphoma chrysanthemicola]